MMSLATADKVEGVQLLCFMLSVLCTLECTLLVEHNLLAQMIRQVETKQLDLKAGRPNSEKEADFTL